MEKGLVQVYYGEGKGKTALALGKAVGAAGQGETVIIIQFLQEKNDKQISFIKKLEPEIKLFRFEKSENSFFDLSQDAKEEELQNIYNGINFAKKVLSTKECSVLILDGLLGLLKHQMIETNQLEAIISHKSEETQLIFTGSHIMGQLFQSADEVIKMEVVKH